jgi:hypothetical protein
MRIVASMLITPLSFMYRLYVDGFKNMSNMSKTLWLVAIIKLIIMFGLLKVFFFEKHLSKFETEQEKIEYISKQLTKK